MNCFLERVFYYWRHGLYGHVEEICKIGLVGKTSNVFLILYDGLAKGIQQNTEQSLDILSKMEHRKDLLLLYLISKFCILSRSKKKDIQQIQELKTQIKSELSQTNPLTLYYSAQVSWFFGYHDLMNTIINKSIELQSSVDENGKSYAPTQITYSMIALQGWIALSKHNTEKALELFNSILEDKSKCFDVMSLYGKAVCFAYLGRYSECIQTYARILSKYDFPELQIEKCRIYILTNHMDFALTISNELKSKLFSLFEVNLIILIDLLLKGENSQRAAQILEDLIVGTFKYEKHNWYYQMKMVLALATICTQEYHIVDKLLRLALHAYETSEDDIHCRSVLGYIQYLARNYVASLSLVSQDNKDWLCMECQIRILIDNHRYSEAQDILDMYGYLIPNQMIFKTLQAKINREVNSSINDRNTINELLRGARNHICNFSKSELLIPDKIPYEFHFEKYLDNYISYRIDAIIDVLDELITFNSGLCGSIFRSLSIESNEIILKLVQQVSRTLPSFTPIQYFTAFLYKNMEKLDDALFLFSKILISPLIYRPVDCFINIAEIRISQNELEAASSLLDEALSEDSTISNSLHYLVLKTQTEIGKPTIKNSIQKIAGQISQDFEQKNGHNTQLFINYVKIIDICIAINDYEMATRFLKIAAKHSPHQTDKAILLTRQAMIQSQYKKFEKSIQQLDKLSTHEKYASLAIRTKAELFLKYFNDQSNYISILQQFNTKSPSVESSLMLGNAYKKLNKFNEAIDVYKTNITNKKDPNERILKELIMTFVSANRFEEAVRYFTMNAQIMRDSSLFSYNFISLMMEMKKFKEARTCVIRVMQFLNRNNTVIYANFLELLGIVESKIAQSKKEKDEKKIEDIIDYSTANASLENSLNLYGKLIKDVPKKNSIVDSIYQRMSNILYQNGTNYLKLNERDKAIESFDKSLEYYPKNSQTVMSLFGLYKNRFDILKCKQVCQNYLALDPQNETIALLLTSAQTNNLKETIPYLRNVLDAHPTYFKCLVRMVELCARSGKLELALSCIKNAKCNDPGYYFVRGLYFFYVGNNDKALKFFKMAKNSNKWELQSNIAIFNILTNPERKYLWFETEPFTSEKNLKEAETILSTLTNNEALVDYNKELFQLMKCDLLCAQNTTQSVHEAEMIYSQLVKNGPSSIPASVGLARCFTKLQDRDKAHVLLKFVLSGKPFHENYSYFEEAYLMIAYLTEKETDFNSAQHYIFLALELNMCCKKGWEMSAKVHMEKKMYAEASTAFGYCWKLCDHSDPEVGYKYAYCSMKAKRYETALIVSREVMELCPDYNGLKEKVIIPSFRNIKS